MKNKLSKLVMCGMLSLCMMSAPVGNMMSFASNANGVASYNEIYGTNEDKDKDKSEPNTENSNTTGQSTSDAVTGTNTVTAGSSNWNAGMVEGSYNDISVTNFSVDGSTVGGKIKISFTATVNTAANNDYYTITKIKSILPVIDESFCFETNNEATKVTTVNATTYNVTYTLTAKDNLSADYYPVTFAIVYNRDVNEVDENNELVKDTDNNTIKKDTAKSKYDYYVTKGFSVRLNANAASSDSATDIKMNVSKAPSGTYGKKCKMAFSVTSSTGKIISVTPVISETFPFETMGDAYKSVTSTGTKSLKCSYSFTVRTDAATGYATVPFEIIYKKGNTTYTTTKSINVKLTGKKDKSESTASADKPKSTPRLMVTGCETSLEQIFPNDEFTLKVKLKNNSKKAVSNIKVTLAQEEKNFISTNGVSSAYVDSIAAGAETVVSFELKADSSLTAKAYGITVKTDYEDASANPFNSEDTLVVPVSLEASLKLDDLEPPYDLYIDASADMSFTITNTGAATLNNVRAVVEGDDFTCEETYVGNITSGASGYATCTLNGTKMTEGEGACKVKIIYEDSTGKDQEFVQDTNIFVMEYVDDMAGTEDYVDDVVESPNYFKPIIIGLVVLAVIVVVVVIIIKSKKKRAKAEEELMDDDI